MPQTEKYIEPCSFFSMRFEGGTVAAAAAAAYNPTLTFVDSRRQAINHPLMRLPSH